MVYNGHNIINNQDINTFINLGGVSIDLINKNPVSEILIAEGCGKFVKYLELLGLENDPSLVVLSSLHHYYYDVDELKNVRTVINMKEFNYIKQIESFLHSIFHTISRNSNFIGSFVDNSNINGYVLRNDSLLQDNNHFDDIENNIVSRIPFLNMVYSFMDLRTNKFMSKRSVSLLLRDSGFEVIDMTELNGLTYFCARSQRVAEN